MYVIFEMYIGCLLVGYRAYNINNIFTEVYDVDVATIKTIGKKPDVWDTRLRLQEKGGILISKSELILNIPVIDLTGKVNQVFNIFIKESVKPKSHFNMPKWSENEDMILRSTYKTLENREIQQLIPVRSEVAIRHRLKYLGLNRESGYRWTKKEREILFKYYREKGPREVEKLLPNRTYSSIITEASKLGLKTKGNYKVREDFFETITEESAWVLGWLVTDGHISWNVSNRVELVTTDKDIDALLKIQKKLLLEGECIKPLRGKNEGQHRLLISSNKIHQTLVNKYGFKKDKTYDFTINFEVPKKYLNHFIRGMLEGDGTIRSHLSGEPYLQVSFVGNKSVVEYFISIIKQELNIAMSVTYNESKNMTLYKAYLNGKVCEQVLKWVYQNTDENTRLNRKYRNYINYLKEKNKI